MLHVHTYMYSTCIYSVDNVYTFRSFITTIIIMYIICVYILLYVYYVHMYIVVMLLQNLIVKSVYILLICEMVCEYNNIIDECNTLCGECSQWVSNVIFSAWTIFHTSIVDDSTDWPYIYIYINHAIRHTRNLLYSMTIKTSTFTCIIILLHQGIM